MLNKLKPRGFARNVLTLMSGTVMSQAIPIAIAPILSRLYSPDEFGLFATYTAIMSVISIVATGRYELAIMFPKRDHHAAHIVVLALSLSLGVSLLALLAVSAFNEPIVRLLKQPHIGPWLYLLPASILLTSLYQCFYYWNSRKQHFKRIALSRMVQGGGTALGQLALGHNVPNMLAASLKNLLANKISPSLASFPTLLAFGPISFLASGGLMLGMILGQLMSVLTLTNIFLKKERSFFKHISIKKQWVLAKRHNYFPKFDVPTTLLNVAASQLPNMLFNILFAASYSGFYYMTQRVLQAPITLISGSVLDVFRQRAMQEYRELGHARRIFTKTFWILALLAGLPSIILYFTVEDIFSLVLGEKWRISGEYARILLPSLFLRFVTNPLSYMIYVAEKQKLNLVGMFCLCICVIAALFLADSPRGVVEGINLVYTCFYFSYLLISAKLAGLFHA